jgi:hypothetical protein
LLDTALEPPVVADQPEHANALRYTLLLPLLLLLLPHPSASAQQAHLPAHFVGSNADRAQPTECVTDGQALHSSSSSEPHTYMLPCSAGELLAFGGVTNINVTLLESPCACF